MSHLYLVGTNHWDLKGAERLKKFLSFVQPTAVGLEASPDLVKLRLQDRAQIKQKLKEEELYNSLFNAFDSILNRSSLEMEKDVVNEFLIAQGYETWASYEYQQDEKPDMDIYALHDNKVLEEMSGAAYQKALGSDNFDSKSGFKSNFFDDLAQRYTVDSLQKEVDDAYQNSLSQEDILKNPEHLPRLTACDDIFEPKIRRIVDQNKSNGSTVIFLGHNHIFAEYNNLYHRLKDLNSIPVKLIDVDAF